ncbi:MAG: metallophosphoesterase, partial [Clostridia bacterium]|nr:metallophosphoesterase [Clostridia bacterium]
MRKHIRLPAFILALLLILPLCTVLSLGSFAGELTMGYEPDAATASLPGYCAGTITITPGSDSRKTGWYALYLASDNEVLSGYEPVAQEQITGKKVTITLPYGMYLPEKATSLVLFEGAAKTPSDRSLEKASAIVKLEKEALRLKDAQFTFASVSDVHLNYDDHGYGASAKWTAALDFFKSKKMEMVVISGDLTESGGKTDYDRYTAAIKASEYPADQIYSAKGNHDVPNTNLFLTATAQADQIHPFPGSAYFHVLKKGEEHEKDNLFIFMAQELSSTSASASTDNFSSTQLDWLEDLLIRYAGTNTNIFIIEHALMRNFGPGDRINGAYGEPIVLDERFDGNMRFKALLTEYKEVIMMSGHTHLSFYELLNYSDEQGTAARMIHNSSVSQPRSYTSSGSISYNSEGRTNARSGSEGYLVYVYEDYILYVGYNLTTKRIIPRACYLLDSYSEERADVVDLSLKRAPDKTIYTVGEWFDGAGMEIEATFADGSKKIVSGWGVSKVGKLDESDDSVEIYYGSLEKTVKVPIRVGGEDVTLPFEGKGSLEAPYLIETAEDFKALTDLFNKSKDAANIFGSGLHFRQTADIDMTDVAGYKGTPANGDDKRYFGGNYDGGGYTLTVN